MVISSWAALYETLQNIDATSDTGFEGFVAELFQAEIGDRFYVAKTGSQPSGDARDERGGVSIQTKAYFGRTALNKNEAVAQLQRAIQSLSELDIYVLASTQDPAQLRDELEWAERQFGIEVLLLHLGPKLTELSALCVFHWDVVERFLSISDKDSRVWADTQCRTAEVQKELERIRARLDGAATRIAFQHRSREILQHRVAAGVSPEAMFNSIDLKSAISRRQLQIDLLGWWNSAPENAVLIGDEGMGKTWVAGDFANRAFATCAARSFFGSTACHGARRHLSPIFSIEH